VIQPATMLLPSVRADTRAAAARISTRFRRAPIQSCVRSMTVVVPLEIDQLSPQISSRPKERSVQTFAPKGANHPFHEWVRERHVRHGLDGRNIEDPQIRLPLMEPIQRIMVRAEVGRRCLASSRLIEHPAQPLPIHDAAMHAKAHDATRALVHHDQNPVCTQDGRFTAKQIEAPQTVRRVTEDREPGRPTRIWCRPEPNGENAPHHILVDENAEGQGNLLSDPRTTPGRIPSFQVRRPRR